MQKLEIRNLISESAKLRLFFSGADVNGFFDDSITDFGLPRSPVEFLGKTVGTGN